MNFLLRLTFLVVLIFISTSILAEGSYALRDSTSREQCQNLRVQRLAASKAKNWTQLEQLANSFVQSCFSPTLVFPTKNIFLNSDYSGGYYDMAEANIKLGNLNKALLASEKCIEASYADPECHFFKAKILMQLNRFDEAHIALNETKELTEIKINDNKQNIATFDDLADDWMRNSSLQGLVFYKNMLVAIANLQKSLSAKKEDDEVKHCSLLLVISGKKILSFCSKAVITESEIFEQ